ncbi:MAG: DNA modification methylase [Planctomycetota bacterium]
MSSAPTDGLTVRRVRLEDLHLDPRNARLHGDANLDSIKQSLARFGQAEPLVVQAGTGHVIGGNGRLAAMRDLGWEEADVVELDVDLSTAKALGIALNRTAELAEWDTSVLSELLTELRDDDALDGVGYGAREIDQLLADLDAEVEPEGEDVAPGPPPVDPITRLGDLWILGQHRLLCGDSCSPADLERLMDGQIASLLATDPPYLVDYKGTEDGSDGHWDDYQGDARAVEFFSAWLETCLPHCRDDVPIYQWHATRRQAAVEQAWRTNGLLIHQTVVWAKPVGTFGRSHFRWSHEPAFYGWREGHMPKSPRLPDPKTRTVWEIDHLSEQGEDHPTQKPLEVFTRPLYWHTLRDEVVLEPFCGSGTQIIAAQRMDRRCFAMELSPAYADVAVRRWQNATKREARLEDGTTFAQAEAQR